MLFCVVLLWVGLVLVMFGVSDLRLVVCLVVVLGGWFVCLCLLVG